MLEFALQSCPRGCVQLANSFGLLIMQIVPNINVPDLLMLPAKDVGASYRLLAALLR